MNTWYEYRDAWSERPWVMLIAVGAVVMVLIGVVGTVTATPWLVFFIPGLAAVYVHHLLVQKIVR